MTKLYTKLENANETGLQKYEVSEDMTLTNKKEYTLEGLDAQVALLETQISDLKELKSKFQAL